MKTFKDYVTEASKNRQILGESYNDRVKSSLPDNAVTKDELEAHLEKNKSKTPEGKLGGKAWSDFKKDAHAHAKNNGILTKAKTERAPYTVSHKDNPYSRSLKKVDVSHKDIKDLADHIENSVANSYPDSDPGDKVTEFAHKRGWDSGETFDKLVPAALKKHLDVKHGDFSKYRKDTWDEFKKNK